MTAQAVPHATRVRPTVHAPRVRPTVHSPSNLVAALAVLYAGVALGTA